MRFPKNRSKKWFLIMMAMHAMIFFAMILVSLILDIKIVIENLMGFTILAIIVSCISVIGGYLGFVRYFLVMLAANLIGIAYMLIIALNRYADGWSDLVSIISYMFVMIIGFFVAVGLEIIKFIKNKKGKKAI